MPAARPAIRLLRLLLVLNTVLGLVLALGYDLQFVQNTLAVGQLPRQSPRQRPPMPPAAAAPKVAPPEHWQCDSLRLLSKTRLATGIGTKSVVMDATAERLYALNLDGMSVCEFDRAGRKLLRKLVFEATPGTGFNYRTGQHFDSQEEKPVEACFSHAGRYLWLSLHNAGGVVAWPLRPEAHKGAQRFFTGKKAALLRYDSTGRPLAPADSLTLPFVATGKTPKVLATSPDARTLYVANWHSNTVSAIDIGGQWPWEWRKRADIATKPIPRGLALSPDGRRLFVAQMGTAYIDVVSTDSLKTQRQVYAGINPRHLVQHGRYLFASLNLAGKLVKIDTDSLKVVRSAATAPQPRTIALSPDGALVFVTCYTENRLQVFDSHHLRLLGSYPTDLHPVGVAVHQQGSRIEAWVCNYSAGNINIFTFEAKRSPLARGL